MSDFEFDNEVGVPVVLDKDGQPLPMEGVVPLLGEVDDNEIMQYTQAVRIALVKKLTKHNIPTDEEGGQLLLSALKDLDGQIKDRQKMDLAKQSAESDAEVRDFLVSLRRNPEASALLTNPAVVDPDYTVVLPDEIIQSAKIIEGQTAVQPGQIEYAEIMDRPLE